MSFNDLLGAFVFWQGLSLAFLALQIIAFIYTLSVINHMLVFEWDGAEKILWLLIIVALPLALGAIVYQRFREPQREYIRAALWELKDPRVFGVAPPPAKISAPPYGGTSCVTVVTLVGMGLFLVLALGYMLWFRFGR